MSLPASRLRPAAPPVSAADRYRQVRAQTLALCAPLAVEDFIVQSMPDASPAKWHLAHSTWFFEEFVLQRSSANYRYCDERFRYLFNSYYRAVGAMHPRAERGLLTRPLVSEVMRYRGEVDARKEHLLAGDVAPDTAAIVILGMHHEQQHQELLLTDIKHAFSRNPLRPAYTAPPPAPAPALSAPALQFVSFAGGHADIGHAGEDFAFDNEEPRHQVLLQCYGLANRPVLNSEYRDFVRDGGYREPTLWLSDGWAQLEREGWSQPLYWNAELDGEFTLHGEIALAATAPACHLSYYEADAFARWAGARLPTEFEWEHAASAHPRAGNFLESGALRPLAHSGAREPLVQL
ncbi:MAG TPA: ergothioneine biosynthesis protein EgtB, partial [Steroidobacteraceae bacterium]